MSKMYLLLMALCLTIPFIMGQAACCNWEYVGQCKFCEKCIGQPINYDKCWAYRPPGFCPGPDKIGQCGTIYEGDGYICPCPAPNPPDATCEYLGPIEMLYQTTHDPGL